LERAVINFARNDALAHELFTHFAAPQDLVRPHTELILKAPALTAETVFERAADVRDAHHGSMSPWRPSIPFWLKRIRTTLRVAKRDGWHSEWLTAHYRNERARLASH
jgi:hypothetical protein